VNSNNVAIAYRNRANLYFNKHDWDKAIADYTQAIRLDPNDDEKYNDRGAAYYNKGDFDSAIADFESALRINPNNSYTKKALEEAKRRRGR